MTQEAAVNKGNFLRVLSLKKLFMQLVELNEKVHDFQKRHLEKDGIHRKSRITRGMPLILSDNGEENI